MLTKPALPDLHILACLQEDFGLRAERLEFLPLGADMNSAVYRATTGGGTDYFVKLRKGDFNEVIVSVPHYLAMQGVPAIISPLTTRSGSLWASLRPYQVILYPYIPGKDGYQQAPTAGQWMKFGEALRSIHNIRLPVEISSQVPCETFSDVYRKQVQAFQVQTQNTAFQDPSARRLAAFMREQQVIITGLVERGDRLARALKARPVEWVLCHSDIHAGNLHLLPDDQLYIVDWDNPTFSPKERDLNLVGGCPTWNRPEWVSWFYQGYGSLPIDPFALAYYRCERIIQDIAAYCEQMFLSAEGGEDREQGVHFFKGQFLPEHEIELAMQTNPSFH